jgi:hypothetical protein
VLIVAHALGRIRDLPIPGFFFLYGGAMVLALSFAALAALWIDPVLEHPRERPLPPVLQRIVLGRPLRIALQTLGVGLFVLVVVAAFAGTRNRNENVAPLVVWVLFWLGLVPVTLVLGNVWAVLSPLRTLGPGGEGRFAYPERLGLWPAAALLFAFVALELVYPEPADPRVVGAALCAYAAVTWLAMLAFGREAWLAHGEAFNVYFGLFALLAPFAVQRVDGRRVVVARPPLVGLARYRAERGAIAFVAVMLGAVVFDSITRAGWWSGVRASTLASDAVRVPVELVFLAATVAFVGLAYLGAVAWARLLTGTHDRRLSRLFIGSLVPIALVYSIAHYFTLLIGQGQFAIRLASDPLNRGWDLFGSAGYVPTLKPLTTHEVWYVQVAALVCGHVVGLVLAHDRAVSVFRGAAALRSQYAMLGLMVVFTVGGLFLLSQP